MKRFMELLEFAGFVAVGAGSVWVVLMVLLLVANAPSAEYQRFMSYSTESRREILGHRHWEGLRTNSNGGYEYVSSVEYISNSKKPHCIRRSETVITFRDGKPHDDQQGGYWKACGEEEVAAWLEAHADCYK